MNKKTEKNQIKQLFNYLLNLGRVTSEGSINLHLPEVSPLLPVSYCKHSYCHFSLKQKVLILFKESLFFSNSGHFGLILL
jgi:hypothetical protein